MPIEPPDFAYDVFISYSSRDKTWVHGKLLPRLERAGLKVCIDCRDFRVGAPSVKELERAVLTSRHTIAVLTPSYLNSAWTDFEATMTATLDPGSQHERLVPLLLRPCDLPPRIKYLNYADFTGQGDQTLAWERLLKALGAPVYPPPPPRPCRRVLGLVMMCLVGLDLLLAFALAWRFLRSEPDALAYIEAMAAVLALILQGTFLFVAFRVRHIEPHDIPLEIGKRIWLCGIIVVMTAMLGYLVVRPSIVCIKVEVVTGPADITMQAGNETIFKGTDLSGVVDVCVPYSYKGQNLQLEVGGSGYISQTATVSMSPRSTPHRFILTPLPPPPTFTLTPTLTRTPTHTPTPTATSTPTPTPAVVATAAVALRAWNDRYGAVTDITSTRRLKAIAEQIDESSKFTLLCLANDKVALKSSDRFVSALNDEDDRKWELRAEAPERLAWEEFTLFNPDTQDPLPCAQVLKQLQQGEVRLAFRTFHGRFAGAMGRDQDWVLKAETTALDRYEEFAVVDIASMPTTTPTATAVVVDTMDSLAGWSMFTDTLGSAINISSAQGKMDNAVRVDFDLKDGGFVGISKALTPTRLSETRGMRFLYTGVGPTDTIELKLLYEPDASNKGEVFSYSQREIAGTDYWVTFEQDYDAFGCGDTCRTPSQTLDPAQVWKIEIAVSHQLGGAPGTGYVLIDQIDAIQSLSPTPSPTPVCPTRQDYHCQEQGALVKVTPDGQDEYCTETVRLPQTTLVSAIAISMTKRVSADWGYSLYEVEAYGPAAPQENLLTPKLFSIETGPAALVAGPVSSYLREQFKLQSTILAPGAQLRFDPYNKQWAIVDADRVYAIRSEDGKLDVYGGGEAKASSTEDAGRIAPYAIDGNSLTRWASEKGKDPQSLEITLPQPALVDRAVLKWERAYALEYCVTLKPAQ